MKSFDITFYLLKPNKYNKNRFKSTCITKSHKQIELTIVYLFNIVFEIKFITTNVTKRGKLFSLNFHLHFNDVF